MTKFWAITYSFVISAWLFVVSLGSSLIVAEEKMNEFRSVIELNEFLYYLMRTFAATIDGTMVRTMATAIHIAGDCEDMDTVWKVRLGS
ncbi:hypothetical protein N9B82_05530, partial [Saprospiraceae bacterium]|nr:hypothetical protein [Saprospiraceae bacterium]